MSDRSEAAAAELAQARKDAPARPEAPEEAPLNAVIIVRTEDDEGNIGTEVFANGDVRPTEVQTVIELGLHSWRKKLGL